VWSYAEPPTSPAACPPCPLGPPCLPASLPPLQAKQFVGKLFDLPFLQPLAAQLAPVRAFAEEKPVYVLGGLTSLLVLPFALLFTRGGAKKVGGQAGGRAGSHGVVWRAAHGCCSCPAVLKQTIFECTERLSLPTLPPHLCLQPHLSGPPLPLPCCAPPHAAGRCRCCGQEEGCERQ
jgi:hypothetical protein